jgi:hypothetical protein
MQQKIILKFDLTFDDDEKTGEEILAELTRVVQLELEEKSIEIVRRELQNRGLLGAETPVEERKIKGDSIAIDE